MLKDIVEAYENSAKEKEDELFKGDTCEIDGMFSAESAAARLDR